MTLVSNVVQIQNSFSFPCVYLSGLTLLFWEGVLHQRFPFKLPVLWFCRIWMSSQIIKRLWVEQKEKTEDRSSVSRKICFCGSFSWWENWLKLPVRYVFITSDLNGIWVFAFFVFVSLFQYEHRKAILLFSCLGGSELWTSRPFILSKTSIWNCVFQAQKYVFIFAITLVITWLLFLPMKLFCYLDECEYTPPVKFLSCR